MEKLVFEYDFTDLKEILVVRDGGLDFRFNNYPYEDLSVETKEWANIQEFLEWYKKGEQK
jgi:hypothetical protein